MVAATRSVRMQFLRSHKIVRYKGLSAARGDTIARLTVERQPRRDRDQGSGYADYASPPPSSSGFTIGKRNPPRGTTPAN